MPPVAWLLIAIVAGIAAYRVGWSSWQTYRSRAARDTNRERYLAWRGRADRGRPAAHEMTRGERRRIYAGAALAVLAVIALLAFFAGT